MRAHLALLAFVAALAGCGSDIPLPDLPPARADLPEAEALSFVQDASIESMVRARIAFGARAGFVVLVARNGRVVHATARGHRDIEAEIPMALDTRFQIASMTKPVIGVAAMILVEEGRLDLDAPVARYLPSFADLEIAIRDDAGVVTGTRPMQTPLLVRHVLAFASGMGPGFEPGSRRPGAAPPLKGRASFGRGAPAAPQVLPAL